MKYLLGTIIGLFIGILDVIPMLIQKLTWDANLSALSMWTVIGFLYSALHLKIHFLLKGILIAFLVLLPSAILIGAKEPVSLIPIIIMTTVLGGLMGLLQNKFIK